MKGSHGAGQLYQAVLVLVRIGRVNSNVKAADSFEFLIHTFDFVFFVAADHADEFHVRLLGKKCDVSTDLPSHRFPWVIVEVRPIDKNDEMGVAG